MSEVSAYLAGVVAFDGDALVALTDDPNLLRKLDRKRWSPSSAKTMAKCPARWAGENLIEQAPDPFSPAEEGSTAHWVFEHLYRLPVAERTPQRALALLEGIDEKTATRAELCIVEPDADPALRSRWLADVWELVMPIWQVEDPTRVVVTGTERRLDTASVAGVPFRGVIDRTVLMLDESGRVTGVSVQDWKTSRKGGRSDYARRRWGDDHGDQLRLYALALENLDGRIPEQVQIIYTATGQTYVASLARPELDRVAAEFHATWAEMKASFLARRWQARTSALCGWCVLQSVCPAAASAGIAGRVDAVNAGEQAGILAVDSGTAANTPHTAQRHEREPKLALFKEETVMVQGFCDDKASVEASPDGRLNGESPAAAAVSFYANLASSTMQQAGIRQTRQSVQALANTYAYLVGAVQAEVSRPDDTTNPRSMMAGVNRLVREALVTALAAWPVPFGADADQFDAWAHRVQTRMASIVSVGLQLWLHGPDERPWETLAVSTQAAA